MQTLQYSGAEAPDVRNIAHMSIAFQLDQMFEVSLLLVQG